MTREEIKNTPELVDFMLDESVIADSRMKLHRRLDELCELAIKALEEELVLDKIRAEIQENIDYNKKMNYQGIVAGLLLTLDIIDKYKAESEE